MPIADLLEQTLDVTRLGSGSLDKKGNPGGTYTTHLSDVPCRAWAQTGAEDRDGRWVEFERWFVYVPADTDITTKDRIALEGRTFEVESVEPVYNRVGDEHHRKLTVSEVE